MLRQWQWHTRIMLTSLILALIVGVLPWGNTFAGRVAAQKSFEGNVAKLRAVHAVPDIAGSPVDVYVDGSKVVTFDFFDATDYLSVPAGLHTVQVTLAGANPATDSVISATLNLAANTAYSAIARGTAAPGVPDLGASVLVDDLSLPAAGQARVRVAHFAPAAPNVDIYVNGTKTITNAAYLDASAYLTVPAGSYTIGVAPTGDSVIYTTTLTLAADQVVTAWAVGLLGGTPAQTFRVVPTIDVQAPSEEVMIYLPAIFR